MSDSSHVATADVPRPPSRLARFLDGDVWASFKRSRLTMVAAALTLLFLLGALLADGYRRRIRSILRSSSS